MELVSVIVPNCQVSISWVKRNHSSIFSFLWKFEPNIQDTLCAMLFLKIKILPRMCGSLAILSRTQQLCSFLSLISFLNYSLAVEEKTCFRWKSLKYKPFSLKNEHLNSEHIGFRLSNYCRNPSEATEIHRKQSELFYN